LTDDSRAGPPRASELLRKGDKLFAGGDAAGAVREYERALKLAPGDALAWNNLGVALSASGRASEAIGPYERALGLDSGFWRAWYNLGKALQRAGRFEEAIEKYDRALAINPLHESSLNNKGYALMALGRHEEALEVLDTLLGANPLYAHGWANKGNLLAAMGIAAESRVCYEIAEMLDPDLPRETGSAGEGSRGPALGPGRSPEARGPPTDAGTDGEELAPGSGRSLPRQGAPRRPRERRDG